MKTTTPMLSLLFVLRMYLNKKGYSMRVFFNFVLMINNVSRVIIKRINIFIHTYIQ